MFQTTNQEWCQLKKETTPAGTEFLPVPLGLLFLFLLVALHRPTSQLVNIQKDMDNWQFTKGNDLRSTFMMHGPCIFAWIYWRIYIYEYIPVLKLVFHIFPRSAVFYSHEHQLRKPWEKSRPKVTIFSAQQNMNKSLNIVNP
jgi:hypothetical protein